MPAADALSQKTALAVFSPSRKLDGVTTVQIPSSFVHKKIIPLLTDGAYIFLVPKMGLEPTHLTAYAPQTYVSTIPPPGQVYRFDDVWYVHPSRMSSCKQVSFSGVWLRHGRFRFLSPHIYHSTTWAGLSFISQQYLRYIRWWAQ